MMKSIPAVCVALLTLAGTPAIAQTLEADSLAEFSGVQRQDGWTYGQYAPTEDPDGVYNAGDFELFDTSAFDGTTWGAAGGPQIRSFGAMPAGTNRTREAWAVRRWTSDVAGKLTIEGVVAGIDRRSDGVVARIYVDSALVMTQPVVSNQSFDIGVQVDVHRGSTVDLTLDAAGADIFDLTRFIVTLTRDPCLSELNGDGILDVRDWLEFLMLWFTLDPRADFNGDAVVDIMDFIAYRTIWIHEGLLGTCS